VAAGLQGGDEQPSQRSGASGDQDDAHGAAPFAADQRP
jgi:hypothetical protein